MILSEWSFPSQLHFWEFKDADDNGRPIGRVQGCHGLFSAAAQGTAFNILKGYGVHKPLCNSDLNQKEVVGILPIKIKTNTFSCTHNRRQEENYLYWNIYKKTLFSNRLPSGQKSCSEIKMIKGAERVTVPHSFYLTRIQADAIAGFWLNESATPFRLVKKPYFSCLIIQNTVYFPSDCSGCLALTCFCHEEKAAKITVTVFKSRSLERDATGLRCVWAPLKRWVSGFWEQMLDTGGWEVVTQRRDTNISGTSCRYLEAGLTPSRWAEWWEASASIKGVSLPCCLNQQNRSITTVRVKGYTMVERIFKGLNIQKCDSEEHWEVWYIAPVKRAKSTGI